MNAKNTQVSQLVGHTKGGYRSLWETWRRMVTPSKATAKSSNRISAIIVTYRRRKALILEDSLRRRALVITVGILRLLPEKKKNSTRKLIHINKIIRVMHITFLFRLALEGGRVFWLATELNQFSSLMSPGCDPACRSRVELIRHPYPAYPSDLPGICRMSGERCEGYTANTLAYNTPKPNTVHLMPPHSTRSTKSMSNHLTSCHGLSNNEQSSEVGSIRAFIKTGNLPKKLTRDNLTAAVARFFITSNIPYQVAFQKYQINMTNTITCISNITKAIIGKKLSMIANVSTQWNSTFFILERALKLQPCIKLFCEQNNLSKKYNLTTDEWKMIQQLCDFLPQQSNNHHLDKTVTLVLAAPVYIWLIEYLISQLIPEAEEMPIKLNNYFHSAIRKPVYLCTTLLNPWYLNVECEEEAYQPLAFWKDNLEQFLSLSNMARTCLAVPASSAPCECAFSELESFVFLKDWVNHKIIEINNVNNTN
ncbi:uncharacterized protein VP01_899g5 [Puccinia sorghi]|uniref:HAT C-terminal dimerisation domain-containing protein n=1 Tax=Puccinia sorghi TaxID=27349 RepID=A0A0L6U7T4_9BASI|nr:uncharacterized protein VP01_899g5 [Puccinia sorghi]